MKMEIQLRIIRMSQNLHVNIRFGYHFLCDTCVLELSSVISGPIHFTAVAAA